MKNTHGEIKKGEDGMGALSLRTPNQGILFKCGLLED